VAWLNDGGGLMLRVAQSGGKSWIYRYMHNGRSHDVGLGPQHTVTLAEARLAALECRKLRLAGKDPLRVKRLAKATEVPTFEEFAEDYIEKQTPGWAGKRTAEEWRNTLRQHVYLRLGRLPLDEIDPQSVLRAIRPVWDKTPEQGRRTLRRIETVLDAAAAAGHRNPQALNPARWKANMEYLLPAAPAGPDEHHESLPYADVPDFLRSLQDQRGDAARALRFLILTGVRLSAAIEATWDEIDLDKRVWTIPVARMKRKAWGDFKVPLSDAAVAVLKECPQTGRPFPIAGSAMPMLLRRRGLTATVHGFRSSFSTWAAEETDFVEEVREACIAHFTGTKTAAAYNRGSYLERRRRLMDTWGRYCCGSGPAEVVELRRA
jgi:integrase